MVQPYSINSSARATNASATVSPSLFATLRLMTNSKRVGCSMADPLALRLSVSCRRSRPRGGKNRGNLVHKTAAARKGPFQRALTSSAPMRQS